MKQNAVTFNGLGSTLGNEATAISDFVKATVEENRADFDLLEVAQLIAADQSRRAAF